MRGFPVPDPQERPAVHKAAERIVPGEAGAEALLALVAEPSVLCDAGGHVLAANAGAAMVTGLEPAQLSGRRLDTLAEAARLRVFHVEAGGLARRVAELELEVARYRELAERDALTGIWNRRAILAALTREIAVARRFGGPLSVAMADVDGLKAVNDTFGHYAGDAVLHALAQRLRERLRAADLVGRWGGDEFLLVLVQTDGAGARRATQGLQAAVSAGPVELPFGGTVRIGVTFGVAEWEAEDEVDALVARADEALYAAKAARPRPPDAGGRGSWG